MSERRPNDWQRAARPLELEEDGVDVWRLSLEQPAATIAGLEATLASDEVTRAERFRFQRDRSCYVLTRAVLRHLLSAYLEELGQAIAPGALRFETGRYGKPRLCAAHNLGQAPLTFNVSHSGDFSLLAFARGRQVGVDIERIRSDQKTLERIPRFFEARECAQLDRLDGEARVRGFFRCWSRKEAFIKATGEGFSAALDSFAVSVGDRAELLWLEEGDRRGWELVGLEPAPGYAGAACVETGNRPVYFRTMTATVSNSSSVQLDL